MRSKPLARLLLLTATATAVVPALAGAQTLEVGSPAPPLELTAADGSLRTLAAVDGAAVLIFYRGLW